MHAHTFSVGITNGTEDSYRSQQESTPGVLYLSADSNLATEKEANFRFFSLFLSSLPSPSPSLPSHSQPFAPPRLSLLLILLSPLRGPASRSSRSLPGDGATVC